MALCGWQREQTPLLKADSTIRLLGHDKDIADADADFYNDPNLSQDDECSDVPGFWSRRRIALVVAFVAWSLMAAPMTFWLGLPYLVVK
jgi:hypothetical protein